MIAVNFKGGFVESLEILSQGVSRWLTSGCTCQNGDFRPRSRAVDCRRFAVNRTLVSNTV